MKREITKLYFGDCVYRYTVRYKEHWWSRWHYIMDGRYPRLFREYEIKQWRNKI